MIRHLLKLVWHRKRANALVMVEIFISFLVVFAVVTLAAMAITGWNRPLGFDWHEVWLISLDTPPLSPGAPVSLSSDDPARETIARVLREAKSFPQVVDAALSDTPAYSNSESVGNWNRNGHTVSLTRDNVSDDFAKVMRVKLVRGRWFQRSDDALGYSPVVVDRDLAREFFGEADPIGQKFDEYENVTFRVVGIVEPYRKSGELAPPGVNMAFLRKSLEKPNGAIPSNIVLRVQPGTPAAFEEELTRRLHEVAPDVPMRVKRMDRMRELGLRVRLIPIVVAGIVALFLITMVALGLTGVLWQTVTRRTREIGLRRALGASGAAVRAQVLLEVALVATLALIAGVVIVAQLPILGIFRIVTPAAFAMGLACSLAMIYGLTVLCGVYPGWLASRVQPAQALHYE
ncbi:MAG TPA: ABC transporter permease [Thermoanaerobaculia bacterium]|nr:ABC transporter permease [Thermoanaerobaculia bacterium]